MSIVHVGGESRATTCAGGANRMRIVYHDLLLFPLEVRGCIHHTCVEWWN
jgi:hypothetical protein